MATDPFVDELLSFLERREARLLSWGFYDVAYSPGQAEATINSEGSDRLRSLWAARRTGCTLESVFRDLCDAGLLYRPDLDADRYRTRFAESVRLIARLRQVFDPARWATAPTLVSDLKIHLKPRRYPRQDQLATDCWDDFASHATSRDQQHELFNALAIGRDGKPLRFAGFQRRAFAHLYAAYGREGAAGTVVSAGTGAGKTKAFYVPALLKVASEVATEPFVKVLAIYPRNVLLADQLREALSEAAKLTPVLARHGRRPIRFGALLGQTPWASGFESRQGGPPAAERFNDWTRTPRGYRIPFLRSPRQADLDLVWTDADRRAGRLRLVPAAGGEDAHVPEGVLAFTRDALLAQPPDVLFVSAEMLNREMGNPNWSRVLGLNQPAERTPRLLLLDEVHSYEGVAGAQVAWVLRRWRYWARPRSLHVVGLSATLAQPARHLARVAALPADAVTEFAPRPRELEAEAQEYNLAVKGDATSGASLLSTTIQTGMLLTRLLTPLGRPPAPTGTPLAPEDYFGRKVFGFTDNLDVINRWMSDLLDAERNKRLARTRLPSADPARARDMARAGQVWRLPLELGHDLTRPLAIGRCSSQDPGLDADRELTVATSTLEVGFDDPQVGAVLQHKSPISLASFVQRKGRAGRRRGTRPWTVVVLGDYGRDRWDFQQIERLFEPQIESIRLPTANPYVLRVQAAYFLLDWLGRRLGPVGGRGPFHTFTQPTTDDFRQRAQAALEELVQRGPAWAEFSKRLRTCMTQPLDSEGTRLSPDDLDAIVWEAPRPLLREVVPTLLRKVAAGWAYADPSRSADQEDRAARHPLPGFLPRATFADLDAAEVAIDLPEQDQQVPFLGVGQALFETCPGRVSKRFTVRMSDPGNWHPFSPQLLGGEVAATVSDLYPDAIAVGQVQGAAVYQPLRARVVAHDESVLASSYSGWEWESSFRTEGNGRRLPLPSGSPWGRVFSAVEVFLHRDRCGVEVTRFARAARYEILRRKVDPVRGRVVLRRREGDEIRSEAVGFQLKADGLRARIRAHHLRSLPELSPGLLARSRVDYFLDLLQASPLLMDRAGRFRTEWLGQTSLAMLTATAIRQKCDLAHAQSLLTTVRPGAAGRVLGAMFGAGNPDADGEHGEGRVVEGVMELWSDQAVRDEVARCETVLWAAPGDEFVTWCRRRYVGTLARALRKALSSRDGDVAEDDWSADVSWLDSGEAEVFVTEDGPGGVGPVEQAWDRLRRDPGALFEGLDHALTDCPRSRTTCHVLGTVAASGTAAGRSLARAFAATRGARDLPAMEAARTRLRRSLRRSGLAADREAVSALLTRVLRPGSSRRSDALLHSLNRLWRAREVRLGVALDPRVFAYHCVHHRPVAQRLRRVLREVGRGQQPTPPQLFALAQQLLLLDCQDACPECLGQYDRYSCGPPPSRALCCLCAGATGEELRADDYPDDWPTRVREFLRVSGTARLRCSAEIMPQVSAVVPEVLASEVEVDYLLMPVRLRRADRAGSDWVLTFELRNLVHGES